LSHKKKRKLEREELEDLTSGSIIELDNFRANQSMDLGRTAVLLEYLSETLSHDRENGRIKQPSCHLLLIMSEREHVKPKGHMGTLFKHATIALKNYAKFVKHANGKLVTHMWAENAVELRDFLKEFRKLLRS